MTFHLSAGQFIILLACLVGLMVCAALWQVEDPHRE